MTEQQGSSDQRKRREYIDLRRRYEPHTFKLAIVAESPPVMVVGYVVGLLVQ